MSSLEEEEQLRADLRTHVIARDGSCCRLCGVYVEVPHVHHVIYRSQGGLDVGYNLVSLDLWCHERVHRNKGLWTPILTQVALTDGVNGLALLRWYRART